jgi:transcriptional regulator with XRE-family HTH domain
MSSEDLDIAALLKHARQAAGLTQVQLANLARTTQPAVAAYECGVRTPTLSTLQRLLDACEHDLSVHARPRVRRGAASLERLAPVIDDELRRGSEADALRTIFGFADDFRGSSRAGQVALLRDEPASTGDRRFDAALAGTAEFFAREAAIPAPEWVDRPNRFVEPWWFVSSRRSLDAYVLANTPAVFARHGVFVAREVFDRA